jgi:di/tricarboxylate transporter
MPRNSKEADIDLMTTEIALTLAVLFGAIALFVWNRFSPDIVALLTMLSLIFLGLLTPERAMSTFSSPVVISIAGIFVLSAALFQTGVATQIGHIMVRLAGDKEWLLIAILMVTAALMSGFMNNVAGTAVLMPAVIGIALFLGVPESRLLLPLALASSYGGTLTLIGSPPNLIASQTLAEAGFEPLAFLEVTPIGVVNLLVAAVFMIFLGRILLPSHAGRGTQGEARLPSQLIQLYRLPERVYALDVASSSCFVGRSLDESCLGSEYGLTVLGIMRSANHHMAPPADSVLQAGDRLLVQGDTERVERVAEENDLSWGRATVSDRELLAGDVGIAEVAFTPRSAFVGRTLRELNFRERFGLTVLALWRSGQSLEGQIADEPLHQSDALLVQGPWRRISVLQHQPGMLVLSEHEEVPRRTRKAPWAIAIVTGMVIAVITKLVPLQVASLAAAVLVVITGCLRVEEARLAVEWRVVLLIAGMLSLGIAMQETGTAQWIARTVLGPIVPLGPLALIAALLLLTGGLTMWVSNHATAALVAPIAMSVALDQGLDPRPLLMAVALGTTVALFTPFAHPSLLLIMGPGSYQFKDYVRVGLPLSIGVFVATLLGLALLYGVGI